MEMLITSLIMFIISFVIVFIAFTILNKTRKNKKSTEVNYLITKFKIDTNKISVKKLLRDTTIIDCLIIALIVAVVVNISNLLLELIIGFVLVL